MKGDGDCGLSPAPWCGPHVPGCEWSQYVPSPPEDVGIAGAGEGQEEREPRTHRAWASDTQTPPECRDPGVWGGRYTWECQPGQEESPGAPGGCWHQATAFPSTQVWVLDGNLSVFLVPGSSLLAHLGNFSGQGAVSMGRTTERAGCGGRHLEVAILKTELTDGGLCGILSFQGFH